MTEASPGILRTGLTLALIAAVCTALVALTWQLTADRIAANQQALLEQSLKPALADLFFDSGVSESMQILQPPHGLPGREAAVIYRVYAGEEPVAALFAVTASDGYAGPIRILIGIRIDGTITGVRILDHQETPGLGDKISEARSDWVYQFDGRSLTDPAAARWLLRGDGGDFDQLTGASITPRAVVKAILETLQYVEANRDTVFIPMATTE